MLRMLDGHWVLVLVLKRCVGVRGDWEMVLTVQVVTVLVVWFLVLRVLVLGTWAVL